MLKLVFLVVGLVALIGMILHIGPGAIFQATSQLGLGELIVILVPMIVVYGLEAFGWRLTLGQWANRVGFLRLFAIRMAGETVNVTTPTAYVGGEPLKAYLLRQHQVPMVEGLASVVTAKTTMTLAQIVFILIGLGLAFLIIGDFGQHGMAMAVSVGVLGFGVGMFVLLQRYGMGMGLLRLLRVCRIRFAFLESREHHLQKLDSTIQQFYSEHPSTFYAAFLTFFVAWVTETLEVFAILYYLGVGVDVWASVSIAALTVFIKGGTFFIPGSLGAQEGGYTLLLMGFGYSEVTGLTFALIRRAREILWILIGLICLLLVKGQEGVQEGSQAS